MDAQNQELLGVLKNDFGSVLAAVPELQKRFDEIIAENNGLKERTKKTESALEELSQRLARREKLVADPTEVGLGINPRTGRPEARVSRELAEYVIRIFKSPTAIRELSEAVGADGGYLVPQERVPELIQLITNYGAFRANALVVPMRSNSMIWPNLATGVTVYWTPENTATAESYPTFGQATMDVKTLVGLTHVSAQLLEDATPDLGQLMVDLFARAIAQEEDKQGFAGTGGGGDPFFGILYASGTNVVTMATGNTTFAQVTSDNLLDLQAAVPANMLANAKYYLHRSVFEVTRKIKDTTNNYIWAPPTSGGPGTIWGYPYEFVEAMPSIAQTAVSKPFVIFGNLRNAYLGDRHALEVARSDQYAFNKLQTFIRVHERIAVKVAQPAAFGILKTSAT